MKKTKKTTRINFGELAGDVIYPAKLTAAQQRESSRLLKAARKRIQEEMTDEDILVSGLLQLRFKLEDYLTKNEYDPQYTFGYFLKEYASILNIKRKIFAQDISIDETLLSQLINMHRDPPDYITIRLEIHSNNLIPADYWYKLAQREKEYYLRTDKTLRKKEKRHVHNRLALAF